MKTDHGHDAVLHHWCVADYCFENDQTVLIGVVSHDRKRRFADGRCMITSMLVSSLDQIGEGAIARTLNADTCSASHSLSALTGRGRANDDTSRSD